MTLIPAPKQTTAGAGAFNIEHARMPITTSLDPSVSSGSVEEIENWLNRFASRQWLKKTGVVFELAQSSSADLQLGVKSALPPEGYELVIEQDQIRILAGGNEFASWQSGWQYGLQSLAQLCWEAKCQGRNSLHCQTIGDHPEFAWRGLHLDVCRHFFDVSFVKRMLDLMAIHKLNRFHWHLTEDQGWRLEIPTRPKLAEISAWRVAEDGSKYGGFYTRDEVAEVIQYAADRCIQVVPEIELPGHSVAALAAYPELACQPRNFQVETNWGIFDDVYCAGNEATFVFLQEVMDYVIELFPGDVIHIGGDECPKVRWKECPKCQARIQAEGLQDEDQLQSYFVQRMVNYLAERGRRAIGWDEILEGGLAAGAMVMSWRGHEGGVAAAKMEHNVVMAPTSHCYFDYRQADDPGEMGFHGVNTLQDVFNFRPVPAELSAEHAKFILGGQANVWTERQLFKPENVEYMVIPRICALAEVLWGHRDWSAPDWNAFLERLPTHIELLVELGYQGRPLS